MKKILLLLLSVFVFQGTLFSQLPSGYCTPTYDRNTDEEIINVSMMNIDNSTTCISLVGTQGTGTGIAGEYCDFTSSSVPVPVLTPGLQNVSIEIELENCGQDEIWAEDCKVWIDFNRDGDFDDAGEIVVDEQTTATAWNSGINTDIISETFNVPLIIDKGQTRMRVSYNDEFISGPCTTSIWTGETEDYVVLLGKKIWDYEIKSVTHPDSISFCADKPVDFKLSFKNVGNQPILGGRVDAYFKGISPSTTDVHAFGTFSNTVNTQKTSIVQIEDVIFPNDELVLGTFIIKHPLDSNADNDTLRRYIQIYKTPTYELESTTVCKGDSTLVTIKNLSKPSFIKWSNQSLEHSTKYLLNNSTNIPIEISRGWKCNVEDQVPVVVHQLPLLEVSNDTVLCSGQNTIVSASGTGAIYTWNNDNNSNSSQITVKDTSRCYSVTTTDFNLCKSIDSVCVKAVTPLARNLVSDTICSGKYANVGVQVADYKDYLFKWVGRNETTPFIQPRLSSPVQNIQTYIFDWYYKGCRTRDSVSVLINPSPKVNISSDKSGICQGFSANLTANGADQYKWSNFSSNNSITVKPLVSTKYSVEGTDINGCTDKKTILQVVYPKPKVHIFSNKFKDNVCLGDSVIIYSNGAKTYNWSDNTTDSIKRFIPTQSLDYVVTGTDHHGCKDTTNFRLSVKPSIPNVTLNGGKGCEGDSIILQASANGASVSYKWAPNETDSFYKVGLTSSTSYPVSITSADECQIVKYAKVEVLPKPIPKVHDVTICKGETAQVEASGGSRYTWSFGGNQRIEWRATDVTVIDTVWVYNDEDCYDSAFVTINVISGPNIHFKSPIDSYDCPNIPVTMVATPYGGVWSGDGVDGNKFNIQNLDTGTHTVLYTFIDPINGCKFDSIKEVIVTKACDHDASSISSIKGNEVKIFPNPFTNSLTILFAHQKREDAKIRIYDLSGREVYFREITTKAGNNEIVIDDIEIASGSYVIELMTEDKSIQKRLMKH